MPIWIRLPELNLRLWDKDAFSAIASVVGMPLKLDEPTAKEIRLSYVRILVEINADADLPEEAYISMHDGDTLMQKIEYEWIPPRCKACVCFGRTNENCTVKKVWKEKSSRNNDATVKNAVDPLIFQKDADVLNAMDTNKTANIRTFLVNKENYFPQASQGIIDKNIESVAQNSSIPSMKETGMNKNAALVNIQEDFIMVEHCQPKILVHPDMHIPSDNTGLTFLPDSLTPHNKKSISERAIQAAINAVSSISSADKYKKKKKRARPRIKSLNDISSTELVEDAADKEFRDMYISKNDKSEKLLKVKNDSAYKKKGKKLEVMENEDSYSDSL